VQIAGSEAYTRDLVHQTVAAILGVEAKLVHVPSDFVAAIDPGLGEKFLGDKRNINELQIYYF
jgi:hypothetical protein